MDNHFPGFSEAMPEFLKQLKDNNTKAWFEANRTNFEETCQRPCLEFIKAIGGEVETFTPSHKHTAKTDGSLRRLHRDVRFSKDKTPYHTYLHLIFWTGDHPTRSPGIHLIFSPGGFGMGAGYWAFSSEELQRYRTAVQNPKLCSDLSDAFDEAEKAGCFPEKPSLKRLPTGFEPVAGYEDLLRHKGIVVRNRNDAYPEGFFDERCMEVVLKRMRYLLPLQHWLTLHVTG